MTLARLPVDKELTEQQKLASPYGLNVHSGEQDRPGSVPQSGNRLVPRVCLQLRLAAAGQGREWQIRRLAKFPKIVSAYLEAGAKCLPVIQKSIKHPEVVDGKVTGRIGPDRYWTGRSATSSSPFPRSRIGN